MDQNASNKQDIGFRKFVLENLVKSNFTEVDIPLVREKSFYRFIPMGLESSIDTSGFSRILNRTLYLTFKYLWFRDSAKPVDRSVIDVADGSFSFSSSSQMGWFEVSSTSNIKLFKRASRYLDLQLQSNGKEQEQSINMNNVKYLISDFHITLLLHFSILLEYFTKSISAKERCILLSYLLTCNTARFDETLAQNTHVLSQISKIFKNVSESKATKLSVYPLASLFNTASSQDRSIPSKISLLARLFLREYEGASLSIIKEKISKDDKRLYDKILYCDLGSLTPSEIAKTQEFTKQALDILKDSVDTLFQNLSVDFSSYFTSDTELSQIKITTVSPLKGTTGFMILEKKENPENPLPIFENNCVFFEDTAVATRIWDGEGFNVFEKDIDVVGGNSFLRELDDNPSMFSSANFNKLLESLIARSVNGEFTNQFLTNAYRYLIPNEVFKAVTGSDKPTTFKDLKSSIYKIVKNSPLLKDTDFVKAFDRKFKENEDRLEQAIRNYNRLHTLAMADKRAIDQIEATAPLSEGQREFLLYLKDAYNKEAFELHAMNYQIKRNITYMQNQGVDLSQNIKDYNPHQTQPLGLVIPALTKGSALTVIFLMLVLGSLWIYFFHDSPNQVLEKKILEELENINSKLELKNCTSTSGTFCNDLRTRKQLLESQLDDVRKNIASEKGVVDTIVYESAKGVSRIGAVAGILGDVVTYGLYGLLGVGAVWAGTKTYKMIQSAKISDK